MKLNSKTEADFRYGKQTSGNQQGEHGRGNIEGRKWEVQIIGCKIGSRMFGTMWGI